FLVPIPDRRARGRAQAAGILGAMKPLLTVALVLPWVASCAETPPKPAVSHTPLSLERVTVEAASTVSAAQEPVALARVGDGKPVCGLGKEFHAGRRAELMKRVGDKLLVFRGLSGPRDNMSFHQDKNFWYLTGVESPDAALVLDGKTKQEILFLPAQN